jgi:rhodanese-related sulfurtransferase
MNPQTIVGMLERRKLVLLFVLSGFLFVCSLFCGQEAQAENLRMTPAEAYQAAQAGNLLLIDVRTPREWAETGTPPGAVLINFHHDQGPAGFVAAVEAAVEGNQERPIGLVCRSGNRSGQAQLLLARAGFARAVNVVEGMSGSNLGPGWLARGLPTEPYHNNR